MNSECRSRSCSFIRYSLFAILTSTAALAQNPTLSLEVTAINSVPLPGGAKSRISATPGDTLTVKLYVRDWSPEGELLRAYQATLDRDGFTSGLAGRVQPVDFENTSVQQQENKANCFIDKEDPQYVFSGLENFALVDTRSLSYRWLSAALYLENARLCPQDGTKFYCGTVNLRVSDDARGSFTQRLVVGGGESTLRDPKSVAIIPLDIEELVIDVRFSVLRILSSNPPNGAIDARKPIRSAHFSSRKFAHTEPRISVRANSRRLQAAAQNARGSHRGWDRVDLTFNGDTGQLTAAEFAIEDGTASPPRIKRLTSNAAVVTLLLDRGISLGCWTTITHNDQSSGIRIGYLPGDVNNDAVTDRDDMFALIYQPRDADALPVYRTDIDGDGVSGAADVLRILDLLTQPGTRKTLKR